MSPLSCTTFHLIVTYPSTRHPLIVALQYLMFIADKVPKRGRWNIMLQTWYELYVKVKQMVLFMVWKIQTKGLNLEVISFAYLLMRVWPKHPWLRSLSLRINLKSDALLCQMNVEEFLFSLPNLIFFFFYLQMWKLFHFYLYPHVHPN